MKTNFQMLRELLEKYHPVKRGIIDREEFALIKQTLHIDEMDILQLRNLRDFTIAHMCRPGKVEDLDRMCSITHCIDCRIIELGGEV